MRVIRINIEKDTTYGGIFFVTSILFSMLGILRRVCLFVGLIVGAGFATGRELIVYFHGVGIFSMLLAGIFMGVVFALFLLIGRSGTYQYMKNRPIGKVMSYMMSILVMVGYVIMTRGAEELLYEIFHVHMLGVITGSIIAILGSFTLRSIKNMNLVIVPLIIVLICVLTHGKVVNIRGQFSMMKPLRYVAMNMLMGGYLVLEEGEKVSNREIVASSSIVAIIFMLLIVMIMGSIDAYFKCSMPLFALSIARGVSVVGGIIIFLGIVTTLLGYSKLIFDSVYDVIRVRALSVLFVIILAAASIFIDFKSAVDRIYVLEGILGIVFVGYVLISYAILNKNKI